MVQPSGRISMRTPYRRKAKAGLEIRTSLRDGQGFGLKPTRGGVAPGGANQGKVKSTPARGVK